MSARIEVQHELALLVESEIPMSIVEAVPVADADIAERMQNVRKDLMHHVGGEEHFAKRTGDIIRSAIDYGIDAPTLFRYSVTDLDPDEKTAVGKRIERLLRFNFKIPRGEKLDICLAKEDVDIKTTMGRNWMFSKSSHDRINLLFTYDESMATFSAGLAYVQECQLNAIGNRDEKRSLSSRHRSTISWIIRDAPYPPNFLAMLPKEDLEEIISPRSGSKRVVNLLRKCAGRIIPRHVICSVANQKDPMKRIRRNGGARDQLWEESILVLCGTSALDRKAAQEALNIKLDKDETLSMHFHDPRMPGELVESYNKSRQAQKKH